MDLTFDSLMKVVEDNNLKLAPGAYYNPDAQTVCAAGAIMVSVLGIEKVKEKNKMVWGPEVCDDEQIQVNYDRIKAIEFGFENLIFLYGDLYSRSDVDQEEIARCFLVGKSLRQVAEY